MSIFVDTSGLYAVFDRDDANHSKARVAWEEWLRQDEPLVTNEPWRFSSATTAHENVCGRV